MKPLSRITDPTVHLFIGGTIAGPGAPQVTAHSLNTARVLDTVACGFPSHSPSSIQTGVADVLINGLPATGTLDTAACGAQIESGSPQVFIGGDAVTIPLNIQGSDDFVKKTQAAVVTLYSTPTGRKIFSDIAAAGHNVTVQQTGDANGYCQRGVNLDPFGTGADSTVSWNPNHPTPGTDAAVILGHELVHADHNALGTEGHGPYDSYPGQVGSSDRTEERQTVGAGGTTITQPDGTPATVPDFSHNVPTENSLRDDLGLPRRQTYYPSTWPGGPPW